VHADDIRTILLLGAGSMGQQIAMQCATHGYGVIVYDVKQDALDAADRRVREFFDLRVEQQGLTREEADAARARIRYTLEPRDGAKADVVNESVPEIVDLKARVFAQFNDICPPRTIFTTNTSSLVPSQFAAASGRPDKLLAMHFYQMVWNQRLTDIMPHPGTSPETVEVCMEFARRIGQCPMLLKKEHPEYVMNTFYGVIHTTAVELFYRGVASFQDIDRAWMLSMEKPNGPFGSLDYVGLDLVWQHSKNKVDRTGDSEVQAMADWLKREYIDKGRLGVKSGKGFYTYPDPEYAQPGFLTGESETVDLRS
jgi:3-hydroxybutyryl-CoA dehydrogenase